MRTYAGEYDPHMSKTFREALLIELEKRGLSLKGLAEGAGVSYEQLKKLKQNKSRSTNVDDAKKIADYLGIPLDTLLDSPGTLSSIEIVDLYNQLSDQERQFLLKSARGLAGKGREEGA